MAKRPPQSADDVLAFIASDLKLRGSPVEPGYDSDLGGLFEGVEKGEPWARVNEHIDSATEQGLIRSSRKTGIGEVYQLTMDGEKRLRERGLSVRSWAGTHGEWEAESPRPITAGQASEVLVAAAPALGSSDRRMETTGLGSHVVLVPVGDRARDRRWCFSGGGPTRIQVGPIADPFA